MVIPEDLKLLVNTAVRTTGLAQVVCLLYMQNISVYHLGLWDTDPLALHERLKISNLEECKTWTVGQPAV
jgi:hypothetical protein